MRKMYLVRNVNSKRYVFLTNVKLVMEYICTILQLDLQGSASSVYAKLKKHQKLIVKAQNKQGEMQFIIVQRENLLTRKQVFLLFSSNENLIN